MNRFKGDFEMCKLSLLVISDKRENIEKLLEPYRSNVEGKCHTDIIEFRSQREYCVNKYNTDYDILKSLPIERLLNAFDGNNYNIDGEEKLKYCFNLQNNYDVDYIGYSEIFDDFDQYMECFYNKKDLIANDYGNWINPNAQWSEWQEVDTNMGLMQNRFGESVSSCSLKDLALFLDENKYETASKYWGRIVDNRIDIEVKRNNVNFPYSKNELARQYTNMGDFAHEVSTFRPYAILTPEGEWFDLGQYAEFDGNAGTLGRRKDMDIRISEAIEKYGDNCYATLVRYEMAYFELFN